MPGYLLTIVLNHSIVMAALIAAIRFKTVCSSYRPFAWLIWLGFCNETISLALIYTKGYNTVNSNIYVLFESMLILYLFYYWQTLSRQWLLHLSMVCLVVWMGDNLIWHSISDTNSLFRAMYACMIVACSLRQIDRLLHTERSSLFKNPVFLICSAFLLYYSCKAFIETVNAFHLPLSHTATRQIFTILYVVDCISNIIYAIALLCIPRKQLFTMQY